MAGDKLLDALVRRATVRHSSGIELETPILVPSFSSKGFPSRDPNVSTVAELFRGTEEELTTAFLVSAYDIHHKYLPSPDDFPVPELIFLDSGGYEARINHDLSTDRHVPHQPHDLTPEDYRRVVEAWPEHVPAAMVSYDDPETRQPVTEQVEAARRLFESCKMHVSIFLLKPETSDQRTLKAAIHSIAHEPSLIADFDIIGVTEEELGSSLMDRMEAVAALRLILTDNNLDKPIHVFGALDPLTTPAYYVAGANVFDGLSWLRYGFWNGMSLSKRDYSMVCCNVASTDRSSYARMIKQNLFFLEELGVSMRKFALEFDFAHFGTQSEQIRSAFDVLRTRKVTKGRN